MKKEHLVMGFKPGAAIPGNTIVKIGAADFTVIPAAAGNEGFGVSNDMGADADSNNCDVVLSGIAHVRLGGTVVRGAFVMSDASGNAVTATGAPINVIGYALESGVANDIRSIFLMQHGERIT